jgi:hypothetical protein
MRRDVRLEPSSPSLRCGATTASNPSDGEADVTLKLPGGRD